MRKFLLRFLVFVLPVVLLAYPLDVYISKNLVKSDKFAISEYSSWRPVMDGTLDTDVLIYGSSRAWLHVNPQTLQDTLGLSTYNLGINGHNFWLQHLRHEFVLERNRQPKLIIQTLDASTLIKREDLHNLEQFLPYMLWNGKIQEATKDYIGFDYLDYKIPLVRYYGKLDAFKEIVRLKRFPEKNVPVRKKGYASKNLTWNNDMKLAQAKYGSFHMDIDRASLLLFDAYLADCKKRGIQVVLVFPPHYIEGQHLVTNWNEVIKIYEGMSKKYGIPFYNYAKDPMSFDRDNFYNSLHLNTMGAEKFSAALARRLRQDKLLKGLFTKRDKP